MAIITCNSKKLYFFNLIILKYMFKYLNITYIHKCSNILKIVDVTINFGPNKISINIFK